MIRALLALVAVATAATTAPLARTVPRSPESAAFRIFTWNEEQYSGDCVETTAKLRLASDGSARLDATTYTRSPRTGSVWHAVFTLTDKAGTSLGELKWDSPKMGEGNVSGDPPLRFNWSGQGTFDGTKLDAVASVKYTHSC
jgi:hypothetical protein